MASPETAVLPIRECRELPPDFKSSDECGAPLAAQNGSDRTRLADREHDDRHTIFPGKREGRRVHDLQLAPDRLLMAQAVVTCRARILFGICAIDPVDISGLEQR